MNREKPITIKRGDLIKGLVVALALYVILLLLWLVDVQKFKQEEQTIKDYDVWKTHEYYSWMYDYCPNCGEKLKVVQEKDPKDD